MAIAITTVSVRNIKLLNLKIVLFLVYIILFQIKSATNHLLPDKLLLSESLHSFQNCTLTLLTTQLGKGRELMRGIHDVSYETETLSVSCIAQMIFKEDVK